MYFFFFLLFSNLAVFFGFILIFFQNPLYSIFSLVSCIFFSTLILFMFGFEFVPFVYLVVYIGAIAILFLFMIMMLNVNCVNSFIAIVCFTDIFFYFCIFVKIICFCFFINKNIFLFYLDHFYSIPHFKIVDYSSLDCGVKESTFNGFITLDKLFTDQLTSLLSSGLDSISELAGFCNLYHIYVLYFILAGLILLFAMLGSISLCLTR